MSVVTISRQCGSDGRRVGRRLAQILGYFYMDKELIVEVARLAGVPVSEAERFDEHPDGAAVRWLKKLLVPYDDGVLYDPIHGVFPPLEALSGPQQGPPLDEDTFVRLSQEVVMHLTHETNAVLMGRGTQALLASGVEAMHVRVVAPVGFRLHTLMERDWLNMDEARRQMDRVDGERQLYIKRHYGVDWDDPSLYHLTVNTQLLGVEGAAAAIAAAAVEYLGPSVSSHLAAGVSSSLADHPMAGPSRTPGRKGPP